MVVLLPLESMEAVPAPTTPPTGAACARLLTKRANARVRAGVRLTLKLSIVRLVMVFMIFLFRI